jgi:hypothetical protein
MMPGFFAAGANLNGGISYRSHLPFGGANGSTVFTDDTGKIWTAFGNAQIDTSLGDQRGRFDGSGDYITTPNHADLQFGTSDFTIAFGIRFASLAGFQTICSRGYTTNSNGAWLVQTGNGNGRLIFYVTNSGTTTPIVADTTTTVSSGVDYDIEIARVGATASLSVNGSVVNSGPIGSGSISAIAEMSIGGGSSGGYNNFWFNGWIKDFRVQ